MTEATATRIEGSLAGPGVFSVPSASMPGESWEVIRRTEEVRFCACPAFHRTRTCRHAEAVESLVKAEAAPAERAWMEQPD